jgi:hypothetical protein
VVSVMDPYGRILGFLDRKSILLQTVSPFGHYFPIVYLDLQNGCFLSVITIKILGICIFISKTCKQRGKYNNITFWIFWSLTAAYVKLAFPDWEAVVP